MKQKIKQVKFGENKEFAAAIANMKRELSLMVEHACIIAEIRKASYDAHIEQGFSKEEALELCKEPFS